MALITKAIRGTQDVLPNDSYKWQHIEKMCREVCDCYGYKEIRTPVFEHTELFSRGVGDTTDVVQKEMYTFDDKGGRSITLRPEGTAGVARSILEHNLHTGALPLKTYYFTSCYRYEKPQAGRLREFHQFGVELYGASGAYADAEIIMIGDEVLRSLGLDDIELQINSIGCPECRAKYHAALKEYFSAHLDELCETCKGRLERNPMRILDCKSPVCSKIAEGAPKILDYICDDCREHFEKVQQCLTACGVEFTINPQIVRGLDYYSRTVFEFVSKDLGAQSTVCGGGRYDGLSKQLSDTEIPAIGFAMGLERLMLILEKKQNVLPQPKTSDIYIASMGDNANQKAFEIATALRREGYSAECDIMSRSLKAQMKYADKTGAAFSVVLGDNELAENKATLKNMKDGTKTDISIDDFVEQFSRHKIDAELADFTNELADADFAGKDEMIKAMLEGIN